LNLPVFDVDVEISPRGSLELISQQEVEKLTHAGTLMADLFRRCALAVLNSGSPIDDAAIIFQQFRDFEIEIIQRPRGVKLRIKNAPATAFVDGRMIEGLKEHLFAVLRDIVYIHTEILADPQFDLERPASITEAVFHILRNARVLTPNREPRLVVCWGGHSVPDHEYEYSKDVGYELGLRGLDICTGCGPGAMKGPMKGAAVGHAKQRISDGRFVGISEPGIIAAEPPNAIVDQLVIMPDIEKRLEAFVRMGHGIVVFPGGAGTCEEILYLLGILLDPANRARRLPLVFTGPPSSRRYFELIDRMIAATLGDQARALYDIVIDDAARVARRMLEGVHLARSQRRRSGDAYYFNWLLQVPHEFQRPFEVSHESMSKMPLYADMEPHLLASNLRKIFSGIVAGNVKEDGIRMIERHGPFEIRGDAAVVEPLDELLSTFVHDRRMKVAAESYVPCYKLAS
jgi:predicted Rossmann-fold nucleotide-binding protein